MQSLDCNHGRSRAATCWQANMMVGVAWREADTRPRLARRARELGGSARTGTCSDASAIGALRPRRAAPASLRGTDYVAYKFRCGRTSGGAL